MGTEIERKYMVQSDDWKTGASGTLLRQGYLSTDPERTVRVRIEGERAWLTIKGANVGSQRPEFEYDIPLPDAQFLLDTLCLKPLIEKTRYRVPFGGHVFEVDEFHGDNDGLIIAEVELDDPKAHVDLPPWIGQEVTGYSKYYNSNLIKNPYTSWFR